LPCERLLLSHRLVGGHCEHQHGAQGIHAVREGSAAAEGAAAGVRNAHPRGRPLCDGQKLHSHHTAITRLSSTCTDATLTHETVTANPCVVWALQPTVAYRNIQQCTAIYSNVQQCTAMYSKAQQCSEMDSNALHCTALQRIFTSTTYRQYASSLLLKLLHCRYITLKGNKTCRLTWALTNGINPST
jgi:hypothetical protein